MQVQSTLQLSDHSKCQDLMVAYGKGLPTEVESQRSLTRRELGTSTFFKIVARNWHPSISRVYIEKYLQLKYAVSTPEKISICLIRGRNESLGNDDVFLLFTRASTCMKWLGWRQAENTRRDRLGSFCNIYSTVIFRILRYVCSVIFWGAAVLKVMDQKTVVKWI